LNGSAVKHDPPSLSLLVFAPSTTTTLLSTFVNLQLRGERSKRMEYKNTGGGLVTRVPERERGPR